MDVHQCPRCELRFVHTSELRHHFEFDHAADPRVFDRYRYGSRTGAEDAGQVILLVGNQTLERDAVLEEAISRVGPRGRVFVVVPATDHGEGMGPALARVRLAAVLDRLRAGGLDADGEVGDADAYAAVCHALTQHDVAEVLLSTLPPASSRWLRVDLPDRLRRHTARPVTVLTPAAAER